MFIVTRETFDWDTVYTFRDSSVEEMGEGYSWAPPGLSPARVEEYMRQLPADKVSSDHAVTCDMFCSLMTHVLQ